MRNVCYAACLMALPLFADADLEKQVTLLECKMKSAHDDAMYEGRSGARFASGRPFYCGYGVWATADVLYWTAFQGGLDYAYSNSGGSEDMIGKVYKAKYEWEVGYRIGFGYSWPQDNWDIAVLFTRINPEAEGNISAPHGSTLSSLFTSNDVFSLTGANIDWNTKLSVLDFEYGRAYFVSRYLYLRPFFGARAGWVHQKGNAQYNGSSQETVFARNDFDGAGLRVGTDTRWFLGYHWNLNLGGSVSALYGHFNVTNRRTIIAGGAETYHTDYIENHYRLVPTAQMLLGLGWETFFSNDGNHIALNVGYELNYWWRQNQLVGNETQEGSPYGTRYSDDLGFHGVSINASISF